MPSLSQRLPPKTCGLFDKGFAGSTADAASSEMNALGLDVLQLTPDNNNLIFDFAEFEPNKIVNTDASKVQFEFDGGDLTPIENGNVENQKEQGSAWALSVEHTWDMFEAPLTDTQADQLADDSLDAFVNLDQLLMGDAYLDEVAEVKPVIEMNAEPVAPVIHIPSPAIEGEQEGNNFDIFDMLDSVTTPDINYPLILEPSSLPVAPSVQHFPTFSVEGKGTTQPLKSRKRKASTQPKASAIKTSLFEIPVSENIVSTTFVEPSSPKLDHDYTSKLEEVEFVNISSVPSTSKVQNTQSAQVLDKATIRRQKNNQASKRSREQRKQKFSALDIEAEELVVANEALRQKIVELEKLTKELKASLVAKMCGK